MWSRSPRLLPRFVEYKIGQSADDSGCLLAYHGLKNGVGELVNLIAALIQVEMPADEIATFQMGTHPLLTASPVAYQLVNAAELAQAKMH